MEDGHQDICRVCRSEASPDKPLYHPCVCTGSIKFVHQDCLVQWLKYSRKEYCELCKHRFSFMPIYSPDMPKRLPIRDIISGLLKSIGRAVRFWLHYTLMAIAWLGIVPLTACRMYRCLFTGSVSSLLMLPLDMLSTDNLVSDCFQGCFVVTCTLCAFISLVWLREQILHGGGPDWLEDQNGNQLQNLNLVNNNAAAAGAGENQGNNVPAAPANQDGPPVEGGDQEENEDDDNLAGLGGIGNNGAAAQDDNWNPIEWDRAVEELTWERLLGLDGSLVFLEHVFWVVSLNTLFILVFAFCPYHIGHFIILGMKSENVLMQTQFEGLLTTLLGYLVIAISLVFLHGVMSVLGFRRFKRVLGVCYIVVKVSLLVVTEIGIFPLICGWWLDICSLSMFDASIKDRESSFRLAPGTSMFIHWLVGMVYVFYFASFILLLREVLRPGVLWFLRNLNDPDFNPIQEMIHLPIYRHVRRFLASMVIFGTTVLVMLWIPIRIIRYLLPAFLPYNVMLSSDAPMSELSLELLLLQVFLPALLEQGHTRQWLKNLVRCWCIVVAWILDLRSYLLGDVPLENEQGSPEDVLEPQPAEENAANEQAAAAAAAAENEVNNEGGDEWLAADEEEEEEDQGANDAEAPEAEADADAVPEAGDGAGGGGDAPGVLGGAVGGGGPVGLGAAHQAMLQGGGPTGIQPYDKPNMFYVRLLFLSAFMCVTLLFASLVSLVVPVYLGRALMSLWMADTKIHELYTAGCGLYTCWVVLRAATVFYNWVPQGWGVITNKCREWLSLNIPSSIATNIDLKGQLETAAKSLVVASLLVGVVPLLLGLLFELVVVAPLRVPLDQSPIFFPWQDWALGVLHTKIICAVTMMGPHWWLKRVIEQVYNQGLRQMDLWFILTDLCSPVISCLSLALAVPYIVACSIVPIFGLGFEVENLVLRRIYPSLLAVILLIAFCIFQARQFRRLYEHIKNDKYLVGQRLVNYDQRSRSMPRSFRTAPSAMADLAE